MTEAADLAVIGAGPAGMACAIAARKRGLSVTVIDEQPAPGGQVWRGLEQAGGDVGAKALYSEHAAGLRTIAAFRASGARYLPDTQLFQIEPGWRLFVRAREGVRILDARQLVIATGAIERPVVFDDWTLPGVMTVGAAQILLKRSGLVPSGPVWLAGFGPLLLFYATQLLAAGGRVAGVIDTRPAAATGWLRALMAATLRAAPDLAKGAAWMARLRLAGVPVYRATSFAAEGDARLEAVAITDRAGRSRRFPAQALFVHEGLVPRSHDGMLAGIGQAWDRAQGCLVADPAAGGDLPARVIGDAARIGGARAALAAGAHVGAGRAGPPPQGADPGDAALRRFLDAWYPPRPLTRRLPGRTLVCRCEEVTADAIRTQAGALDLDQIKIGTRAGMGRCQGRQCGIAAAQLHGLVAGRPEAVQQTYRARPPLKPLRLSELAALNPQADQS